MYDLFTTLPDARAQFFQIGYFLPSLCDEVRRHCVSLSLEGTTQRPLQLTWTSTARNPITPLRICHPSSIRKKPPPILCELRVQIDSLNTNSHPMSDRAYIYESLDHRIHTSPTESQFSCALLSLFSTPALCPVVTTNSFVSNLPQHWLPKCLILMLPSCAPSPALCKLFLCIYITFLSMVWLVTRFDSGLFSFASTTLILSLYNLHTRSIDIPNVVFGMALF